MNYRFKKVVSFLAFFGYLIPVICQPADFNLKTYTTENGLPHNHVRNIVQDHYGFLWVATWDGLACFDGFEFRKYFHEPGDSTTLDYFEIHDLAIDKNNIIWVIARHLCSYDRKKDRFITWSMGSVHHI